MSVLSEIVDAFEIGEFGDQRLKKEAVLCSGAWWRRCRPVYGDWVEIGQARWRLAVS